MQLSFYLVENGPIIDDEDTVGRDEDEKITVVYGESAFGHPQQVMRLDFGSSAG
ncbi:MAG: hypothetical protein JWN70_4734 [Planctomycetaceae bacterium]|nr:hypothetical protein [Planctomycetaceae bacterium]